MINSNFGFTPLKELWLGDTYPESFYDHLPNEIADPFRQITEWTKEDTNKLQKFLEGRGITVRRPVFTSIDDYVNNEGNLVKPPVTPRDDYLVLGKTLYSLRNELDKDQWGHWIYHYQDQGFDVQVPVDQPMNCLHPPAVVRMGRDLYIDYDSHANVWGYVCEWMVNNAVDYRINVCATNGHSDAVFCPVAKNTLVSSHYKHNYNESFPNWEIFRIPNHLDNHNFGQYYNWSTDTKSIDSNQAFGRHIIEKAGDWVGNHTETVYEVNMLVLDEHNVVAMKEYPPLFEWLDQRGITVHQFDLRTRTFWDGGWHCFTLDIHREDAKEDLFPERGNNGVYWKLN